jgi:hypothetical protein
MSWGCNLLSTSPSTPMEWLFLWDLALGREGLREPPGGPVGVRSTERSEPRKVATRSEAKGHAQLY